MHATPVIVIFDIGKTNKKLFLFDESYQIVHEESTCLAETVDDDGDPCEDLQLLEQFVLASLESVLHDKRFQVKAVNFSTYGASFVHVGNNGRPVTPLYNYLKVFPPPLLRQFYETYGGERTFSVRTASPVLGHLNSGMQLYWLKHERPQQYSRIAQSLHLPQYLCFLLSGQSFSDLTSIGCHTNLWDFSRQAYDDWVMNEGVAEKLAPLVSSAHVVPAAGNHPYPVGVGLHDSSAALIPYLASFREPFLLLSTGTWCISLNPFNHTLLTADELAQDCLCYLTYEGKPVKASRLFAGNEHEQQTRRLAAHFSTSPSHSKNVRLDGELLRRLSAGTEPTVDEDEKISSLQESAFAQRDLSAFSSYEEAYHQFMIDLVAQQVQSTRLVLKGAPVKTVFVDGGFSNNSIYMHLLAEAFPEMDVYAAKMAQASALGAAMAVHPAWNSKPLPHGLIELKNYNTVPNL